MIVRALCWHNSGSACHQGPRFLTLSHCPSPPMGYPHSFRMATAVPAVTYKQDNNKGKKSHPFLCTSLGVKKVEDPQ